MTIHSATIAATLRRSGRAPPAPAHPSIRLLQPPQAAVDKRSKKAKPTRIAAIAADEAEADQDLPDSMPARDRSDAEADTATLIRSDARRRTRRSGTLRSIPGSWRRRSRFRQKHCRAPSKAKEYRRRPCRANPPASRSPPKPCRAKQRARPELSEALPGEAAGEPVLSEAMPGEAAGDPLPSEEMVDQPPPDAPAEEEVAATPSVDPFAEAPADAVAEAAPETEAAADDPFDAPPAEETASEARRRRRTAWKRQPC